MDPQPELATTSISLSAYLRLVRRNPNFRRLWLAQIVSELGDWFYTLAIYSLLLQLTGRASSVALALVLQVLPQTFIGPAAGVINDRVRRKRVMITADLARMVIVFAMLLVRSRSTVWMVYPLLLAETLMAAFFEPARTSVIPNITPREDVLLANTLSSATWSVNLLIGASIGGVVAALLGRDAVFVLNALSFLVSAIFIGRMRFEEPHAHAAAPLRARDALDFSPVLEGIRYVRQRSPVAGRRICQSWGVHDRTQLGIVHRHGTPVFPRSPARDRSAAGCHTGHEPAAGSARQSAQSSGRCSRHAGQASPTGGSNWVFCWDIVTIGTGYFGLGLAPNVWVACLCIALAHCGGSTVWVFSTTLLQLNTEDRFRGRVFSADLGFCHAHCRGGCLRLRGFS